MIVSFRVVACALVILWCVSGAGAGVAGQRIEVYPEGPLNPRVPMISPADGGAEGLCIPFRTVNFCYALSPHLSFDSQGSLNASVRDNMRRESKQPLVLVDGDRALMLRIGPASGGRTSSLAWLRVVPGAAWPQYTKAMLIKQAEFDHGFGEAWDQVTLDWDATHATLRLNGRSVASVALDKPFNPKRFICDGWAVDELDLQGLGRFTLGWEHGYVGHIATASPAKHGEVSARKQPGGLSARLLGFDSSVVGIDPSTRDYPMIQVANSTAETHTTAMRFELTSEVNELDVQWDQEIEVGAGQSVIVPIAFPFEMAADVYHLRASTEDQFEGSWEPRQHFMFAPRRNEPRGEVRFGLHDSNVKQFGFWPDALPLDLAHHYLYWGYVVGPAWGKDNMPGGGFGLDPQTPSDQWNWNERIEWSLAAGRTPYVCVQGEPLSDWQRTEVYPGEMKKYGPGLLRGGQADIQLYRSFLAEVAERYKGRVRFWEIENEPSSHLRRHPDEYVRRARAVYEAIKSVDPDAAVFGICGTSQFVPWMKQVFDLGGSAFMDGVSWHTYTTPNAPDAVNLRGMLDQANTVVDEAKPELRILNSETGVYISKRDQADRPIPADQVKQRVKEGDPRFVRNGWMSHVVDEWSGGASFVQNTVYNFLAGTEAYVFFGWNPKWPIERKSPSAPTGFSLLSQAFEDGQRTPSLATLAVGVLTCQLEGVELGASKYVEQGLVRGGSFKKAGHGRVTVLWSIQGQQTALIRHQEDQPIDVVQMLGGSRRVDVTGDTVFAMTVGEQPIYLHSSQAIELAPSPFEDLVVEPIDSHQGRVRLTLSNPFQYQWSDSIGVAENLQGVAEVTPAKHAFELEPGQTQSFVFHYALPDDGGAARLNVEFVAGDGRSGELTTTAQISTAPVFKISRIDGPVTFASMRGVTMPTGPMLLDRLSQVKIGRPPALTSLQEAEYWSGKDELSASVVVAYNDEGLCVLVDVSDDHMTLPEQWPSINGSVVELFLDLRDPETGLGDASYESGVIQWLVHPGGKGKPQLWSPQRSKFDSSNTQVTSQPHPDGKGYTLLIRLPWTTGRPDATPPQRLGFDVAINGVFPDRAKRKTQILLFGGSDNSRNAENFGVGVLLP